MSLVVEVVGTPAPQGSKRGFVVAGRVQMVESSKKVAPWRQDVKAAALNAIAAVVGVWAPFDGPVQVRIDFTIARPRYHFGTGKNAHLLKPGAPSYVDKKPDIDKLSRSTLDALGEAGVWRDDAQVASLCVFKTYATTSPPGARIEIHPLNAAADAPPSSPHAAVHQAVAAPTSTPGAATVQEALL